MNSVLEKKMETPDYENPPVIEVVCGMLFKSIGTLLSPHIGLLWEKYKSGYPEIREVAPLHPLVEQYDEPPQMTVEIGDRPPMPRVWFLSKEGNGIVQVQRDRFLHNWRQVKPDDEYPRYSEVKQMFKEHLSQFESFLEENNLGVIEPLQYEMTYINHILQGEGWDSLSEIGKVFPDFSFRVNKKRFLPEPSGVNWRTTFILPEKTGRMHVTTRHARMRETGRPVLILDLTVRGIGDDKSRDAMWQWFDLAREWIVCGFADLTGEEVQKNIWKRKK